MNKKRLVEKIEKFLVSDLWGIPEVQDAVEQLESIANQLGLSLNDMIDFHVDYDHYTDTLGVEFYGPKYDDVDDDEVLDRIQQLQNVIRWVVIEHLEKMLAGNDYEIVNQVFKN